MEGPGAQASHSCAASQPVDSQPARKQDTCNLDASKKREELFKVENVVCWVEASL